MCIPLYTAENSVDCPTFKNKFMINRLGSITPSKVYVGLNQSGLPDD